MRGLCPGKSQFVKQAQDLAPGTFRRLVARRARSLDVSDDVPLTKKESDRKRFEKLILEKINEEADFLPARFLADGALRARAVCRIIVPERTGRSMGSGFLIAPGVLMTNNHVLQSESKSSGAFAEFEVTGETQPRVVTIRPDQLFITDRPLDFTIVACDEGGLEDIDPIQLAQDSAIITRHERVNIIQHPRGRPKEVAIHDNRVVRVQDLVLKYETDTEPGSSGSPVFNNAWDLVGLHHAGVKSGTRATNEGIRISAIVEHLIRRFRSEESAGSHDLLRELLGSVSNSSPWLGFFGSAGLPNTDQEIQVNDFQGTPAFADVGVWNIEHFNNRVARGRVADVGEVVSRLGLDVIGLTEVENGALNQLLEELRNRGHRHDFVLRDTRGSQDIAVLFDTDTTEVTRRKDIADRHRSRLRARTSANKTAFPRFPLFAQCRIRHGEDTVEFIMIVVHLKAFGDEQSRARRRLAAEKLAEIVDDIREQEGLPVVLGGDFNERLDNDVLSSVTDSPDLFTLTADDATDGAISYVGDRHRSLIDHLIVSNDVSLGDISGDDAAIVRLDRSVQDFADQVSDHVPVVFRMLFRDVPIVSPDDNGDTDDDSEMTTIEIPEGAERLAVSFE